MRHPGMALSLLLSFSELAWIASFFISLVYVSETQLLQDRLQATQTRLKEAENETARLGRELGRTEDELRNVQQTVDRLTVELSQANAEVDRLTVALNQADAEVDRLTVELSQANAEVDRLTVELNHAKKRMVDFEQELTEAKGRAATRENTLVREADEWRRIAEREPGIRKEIVGLKGKLKRVVIVVDRSQSMLTRSRDMAGGVRNHRSAAACRGSAAAGRECRCTVLVVQRTARLSASRLGTNATPPEAGGVGPMGPDRTRKVAR